MHTLKVTLKQHTPLIHFQHDQEGATLRASEVKPKLDKFILTKLGGKEGYQKGLKTAIEKGWIINNGKNDCKALNYKMRITPAIDMEDLQIYEMNVQEKIRIRNKNQCEIKRKYSKKYRRQIPSLTSYPLFFGNMDIDYESDNAELKRLAFASYVDMELLFIERGISTPLYSFFTKELICEFFLKTNFGSRQSKGFGSFYVDEEDQDWYVKPCTNYSFNINVVDELEEDGDIEDEFRYLFSNIDLFYKTLRGGINLKDRSGYTTFYFKSLAFMYAKDLLKGHWDKRAVKEQFYNNGRRFTTIAKDGEKITTEIDSLPKQIDEHGDDCEPLTIHFDESYDIRDMLGFSTNEEWMSFKDSIEKKSAIVAEGKPRFPNRNEALPVERMQSPLLFKPIYNEDGTYTIFLVFQDDKIGMENFKKQQKICFYSKNERDKNDISKRFMLDIPNAFSLQEYFDYIFNTLNFDISKHVEIQYHGCREYRILEDIYSQLKGKSQCNTPE
ncbi:hypothetical protein [Bacteroides heparinolyticus]|uniref:hypothetical protein n=1 Tax=Prevotella heparinolytica TaxID=28113 RepID=UPI0035A1B94E